MMRVYTIFVIIVIAGYYLGGKVFKSKDPVQDLLEYSTTHPNPTWSPKVVYWVGVYHYQKTHYPKAQEVMTQLLLDYPTCQYAAPALMTLGYAAEENHDWEMAKSSAKQYIEQFPKGDDIEIAQKRLEMIKYRHGESVAPFPIKDVPR